MYTILLIRFDAELNAARDETSQERITKEQLAREKATMKSDMDMLQQQMNMSYALSEQHIVCADTRTRMHTRTQYTYTTHTHTHTHAQYTIHTTHSIYLYCLYSHSCSSQRINN